MRHRFALSLATLATVATGCHHLPPAASWEARAIDSNARFEHEADAAEHFAVLALENPEMERLAIRHARAALGWELTCEHGGEYEPGRHYETEGVDYGCTLTRRNQARFDAMRALAAHEPRAAAPPAISWLVEASPDCALFANGLRAQASAQQGNLVATLTLSRCIVDIQTTPWTSGSCSVLSEEGSAPYCPRAGTSKRQRVIQMMPCPCLHSTTTVHIAVEGSVRVDALSYPVAYTWESTLPAREHLSQDTPAPALPPPADSFVTQALTPASAIADASRAILVLRSTPDSDEEELACETVLGPTNPYALDIGPTSQARTRCTD